MKYLSGMFQGKVFYTAVTLLLVFIMAARTPLDTDLWWHLRAGEEFLDTGRPVMVDTYSFTRQGLSWTNHSYLSQLFLAIAYRLAGFTGVGFLMVLVIVIGVFFILLQMKGHPLFKLPLLILGSLVMAPVWSARPQVFSFLMLGITTWIMYQWKNSQDRRIYRLPFLFILWSNLHGGYPLGLIYLGTILAALGIQQIWMEINRKQFCENREFDLQIRTGWRKVFILVGVLIASYLLTAINPNGIRMWLVPFETVNIHALQTFLDEWSSPNFHQFFQQPFLWLLGSLFLVAALGGHSWKIEDALVVVVFGWMAFIARRNFAPFSIVSLPILSHYLWKKVDGFHAHPFISSIKLAGHSRAIPSSISNMVNLLIVLILLSVGVMKLSWVTSPGLIQSLLPSIAPVGAVKWLKENIPAGRVFNDYNWGGYLIWELRAIPVFIDGRTDLYGDTILNDYIKIIRTDEGWQAELDKWEIGTVIIPPSTPLAKQLKMKDWKIVYEDQRSIIIVR
ncbi:MAG TPA: hypothetical protein VIO61_10465 [Anaerolineaceae bacterium]